MESNLSRRHFSQLTAAALGGLMLGTSAVHAEDKKDGESLLLKEPHVCRGLNTCKGLDDSLAREVQRWFRDWSAAGYFQRIATVSETLCCGWDDS